MIGTPDGTAYARWQATASRSAWQWAYGGPVAQNVGVDYTLTDQEKQHLSGVDANPLLEWMSAHTNVTASTAARNHFEHCFAFTGHLRGPVLTMHGILDPLARVSHESVYRDLVVAAGKSGYLAQALVNTYHAGVLDRTVPGRIGGGGPLAEHGRAARHLVLSGEPRIRHRFRPATLAVLTARVEIRNGNHSYLLLTKAVGGPADSKKSNTRPARLGRNISKERTTYMLRFILLGTQAKCATHVLLPAGLTGTLDGAEYQIRVPASWNGTLLVWAHGAVSPAVQVAPSTLPSLPTLEDQLLRRGYALAGIWYEDSIKVGVQRTVALTNFFKAAFGNPRRVIVWGMSLGAQVTLDLIEKYPGIYDAAISASGSASRAKMVDLMVRYSLAYETAFGWPSAWWGPIENVRDDLYGNEATLIAPVFEWYDGTNFGRWEFIRLVMKLSADIWWNVPPPDLPGYAIDGWLATAVRSLYEQECAVPIAENVGAVYTLMDDEKAYLSGLGVNANSLLETMNAHTNTRRAVRLATTSTTTAQATCAGQF